MVQSGPKMTSIRSFWLDFVVQVMILAWRYGPGMAVALLVVPLYGLYLAWRWSFRQAGPA